MRSNGKGFGSDWAQSTQFISMFLIQLRHDYRKMERKTFISQVLTQVELQSIAYDEEKSSKKCTICDNHQLSCDQRKVLARVALLFSLCIGFKKLANSSQQPVSS